MVNILVHLLGFLSFRLSCTRFLLSKFAPQLKLIQSASRVTRSLCHKFNFQGPALKIVGLTAASPNFPRPRSSVLSVRIPFPRVPALGSRVSGSYLPGLQGHRFPGPGSQRHGPRVSDPDFRPCFRARGFVLLVSSLSTTPLNKNQQNKYLITKI